MAKCVKGKECNGRCIKKEYNCRDKSKTPGYEREEAQREGERRAIERLERSNSRLMLGLEGKKKSKKESVLPPSEKELKEALQDTINKAAKRDTGLMLGLTGKKSKTKSGAKAFINDETLGKSASMEDVVLTDVNMAPKTSGKYGPKKKSTKGDLDKPDSGYEREKEVKELAKKNLKELFDMADEILKSESTTADKKKAQTYKALEENLGGKKSKTRPESSVDDKKAGSKATTQKKKIAKKSSLNFE